MDCHRHHYDDDGGGDGGGGDGGCGSGDGGCGSGDGGSGDGGGGGGTVAFTEIAQRIFNVVTCKTLVLLQIVFDMKCLSLLSYYTT